MNYLTALMFILPQAKWRLTSPMPENGWTYDDIIWLDLFYPKPTDEELKMAYKYTSLSVTDDYRIKREEQYPSAEKQLAMIFDIGLDGWRDRIQNIKDNIPKPEVK
jgi:hypothetical protein